MATSPRVVLSWSSGKDCAWALHVLRSRPDLEVVGLLTSFNAAVDRVAMHAVRRRLVEAQAAAAGLPLTAVPLPWPCSNDDYLARMAEAVRGIRDSGATHLAFGDLFLEDVRDFRSASLAGSGVEPLFPLWCSPAATPRLAAGMLAAGLRATVTCVDPRLLPAEFVGREFDDAFLRDLPADVDPCGERGEFHTFCHAGPMFSRPIPCRTGDTVDRDGFVFADVVPA
jgi:diphthamide synthase (EF-2-diphthine--ammonia ligase)